MRKNRLSSIDISIFSFFLFRSYITIGLLNLIINISNNQVIFSAILGSLMGFLPVIIFIFINDSKTEENIFDKINNCFKKAIAPLLNVILIISVFLISSYSLYNISLFINYSLLNDMALLPIMIAFILVCIYLSSRGIKTIIRVSVLCFIVFIIISLINLFTLVPYSNPLKLFPLVINNKKNIYVSGLYYMLVSTTALFLLLVIPKNHINNSNKYNKFLIISYIVSMIYNLITIILIISILGYKLSSFFKYPEIVVLQKVSLLNFIERIEDILSFKMLFDLIFILVLGLFYIKSGIMKTFRFRGFNKHYLFDLIIGGIILIISSCISFNSIYFLIIALSIIFFVHVLLFLFICPD